MAPFMLRDIELLQEDNEVLVLHLVDPDDLSPDEIGIPGIRVIRVPYHHTKPQTWWAAARAVRKYAHKADLVHTMALPALFPAWLAGCERPWVHTEHFSDLVDPDASRIKSAADAALKTFLRLPDQIIVVGSALGDVVNKYSRHPASVVANHVAISHVARSDEEELHAGGPVRMVAIGGLIARKGPLNTVEALAELRRRGIEATLTWVGVGPQEQEVRKLARSLAVEEYVTLRGSVPPSDIPEVLAQANIFVLPTANETFGVALAEALGHGLPVVAAGTGGHLEFLPPEASRVVEERSGVAIADAVEELMEDTARWRTAEVTAYARSKFSNEARLRGYREVYAAALDSGLESRLTDNTDRAESCAVARAVVFHTPYPIQDRPIAASALRPKKMRQAFIDAGYDVIDVTGFAKQRRQRMKKLFARMDVGLVIDFVYSERATIPNSFTEPKHLPLHLLLDRVFFRGMKKRGVPVGVFYRDVYWAFPEYVKNVGRIISVPMKMLYRWDLDGYARYLEIIFVPSLPYWGHVQEEVRNLPTVPVEDDQQLSELPRVLELPPAADFAELPVHALAPDERLHIFYVGGLDHHLYDLSLLIEVVSNRDDVQLTLCVPRQAWESFTADSDLKFGSNVEVVHALGEELDQYYERAHICSIYMPPEEYRDFAVPVKMYEYLAHSRPVFATQGSLAASFLEKGGMGWSVPFTAPALEAFLDSIRADPSALLNRAEAARTFGMHNGWTHRAREAADALYADH